MAIGDLGNAEHALRPWDLAEEFPAVGDVRFDLEPLRFVQRPPCDAEEPKLLRVEHRVLCARQVLICRPLEHLERRGLVLREHARLIGDNDGVEPRPKLLQLLFEPAVDVGQCS